MAMQITVVGDDKDELVAALQVALDMLSAEPAAEEEVAEEEVEEVAEEEVEVEEEVEDPMDALRTALVAKVRAMSKKPAEIEKLRAAFKKVGIKKYEDSTPDKKLPVLAKLIGVKA